MPKDLYFHPLFFWYANVAFTNIFVIYLVLSIYKLATYLQSVQC